MGIVKALSFVQKAGKSPSRERSSFMQGNLNQESAFHLNDVRCIKNLININYMLRLVSFHLTDLTHLSPFLNLQRTDHFSFIRSSVIGLGFQSILCFLSSSEVTTKFDNILISN